MRAHNRLFQKTHLCNTITLCCAAIFIASCSTWQPHEKSEHIKIGEKTTVFQNSDFNLESDELPPVSLQNALSTYQRILKNATHPEAQQKILHRIADLNMMATEQQLVDEISEDYRSPLNRNEQLTLENSIRLYENLLANSTAKKSLLSDSQAEIYYHLAKLYDMTGQSQRSLNALNTLVSQFPNNPYQVEAQFRRAENLFSIGHFSSSARAYEQTIDGRKDDPRFYEQALYKLGWSHYKRNDFSSALRPFVSLLDELESSQVNNKTRIKMKQDTYRVISLAFSQLEGAQSISQFFNSAGQRQYEAQVYEALAMHYLQQERYSDTAKTLEHFVNTHPLHPYAPGFQTDAINALAAGGFPSLVLPAKENFVTRFGIHSAYWHFYHSDKPSPEQAEAAKDLRATLKSHLQDLSTHYHSQAIQSGNPKDYEKAAYWYRLLLETFPDNPNGRLINQLIAESLLDGGQFQEAITQFEYTANHPQSTPESAANNRYAALIAYQSQLKQTDVNQQQVKQEKIAAALRFNRLHPEDKRNSTVLHNAMLMQFQLGDSSGALETASIITQLQFATGSGAIIQNAWITLGESHLSLGRYKDAEEALENALRYPMKSPSQAMRLKEQRVAAIYKQAEQLQQQGQNSNAIALFLSVGQILPQSRIRPQADFAAASLYLKNKQWQAAITQLKAFKHDFPNHPLNETLSEKLALAYEQSQNWAHAAVEMEKAANHLHQNEPELARTALWKAAEFREKAGQSTQAIRVYKRYAWTYPKPLEALAEAQYRLSKLYEKSNDSYRTTFWRRKIVQGYYSAGKHNTARMRYLAAQSAYQMAQPHHQKFKRVKLNLPLKSSIAIKQEAMQQALKYYGYALEIGEARFVSAALFQTASLYQELASDLIASQRPENLSASELEQYEILLEEQAFPFEDRAIESYIKNTELLSQQTYDQWVKKSYQQLRLLLPVRYAKDEKVEGVIHVPL
jgi:tetratricopeptide (TPR) repeat protein